jgi:hypothetical protein
MKPWSPFLVPDLIPFTRTATVEEQQNELLHKRAAYFSNVEAAEWSGARLSCELVADYTFSHPRTWTEEEIKKALAETSQRMARTRCSLIIQSIPPDLLPTIAAQLEEIAEHEMRVWKIRSKNRPPDIVEFRMLVPFTK